MLWLLFGVQSFDYGTTTVAPSMRSTVKFLLCVGVEMGPDSCFGMIAHDITFFA